MGNFLEACDSGLIFSNALNGEQLVVDFIIADHGVCFLAACGWWRSDWDVMTNMFLRGVGTLEEIGDNRWEIRTRNINIQLLPLNKDDPEMVAEYSMFTQDRFMSDAMRSEYMDNLFKLARGNKDISFAGWKQHMEKRPVQDITQWQATEKTKMRKVARIQLVRDGRIKDELVFDELKSHTTKALTWWLVAQGREWETSPLSLEEFHAYLLSLKSFELYEIRDGGIDIKGGFIEDQIAVETPIQSVNV